MRPRSTRKRSESGRLAAPSALRVAQDVPFAALREYSHGQRLDVERAPVRTNQVGTGLFGQRAIDHHGVEIDQTVAARIA